MTNSYKHKGTNAPAHRAVANEDTSPAQSYPAVHAVQKKSSEEEELQMKSVAQLAKPEEEELQMKSFAQLAQPEEELQMKSANGTGGIFQRKDSVPPKANQTGMPDQLKSGIENLSGFSMNDVKVHYNSDKPAQLNALAYAQGTNIHIGPGQERHLPHEAWHVVQQKQGRVRPTMQMKEVVINDDKGLEREADVMGAKAINTRQLQHPVLLKVNQEITTLQAKPVTGTSEVIQAVWKKYQGGEESDAEFQWDEIMDGVRWYANNQGDMWFRLADHSSEEYAEEGKKKKWIEWHLDRHKFHPNEYPISIGGELSKQDIPVDSLKSMSGKADLSGWNTGKKELINAHHKFPKSALAWLFEHMLDKDKEKLRKELFLSHDAGPSALSRLRSNLISADFQEEKVASSNRLDDPHNNIEARIEGEESLDLAKTLSGSYTPRSEIAKSIADGVAEPVYLRCKIEILSKGMKEEEFRLNSEEATKLIAKLREMEEIHYSVENEPSKPSHSSGDIWDKSGEGKFRKKDVDDIKVEGTLEVRKKKYERIKNAEIESRRKEEAIEREKDSLGERAPRWGDFAFMSKSERLGMATMGRKQSPKEGSYSWIIGNLGNEWERNLFSVYYSLINKSPLNDRKMELDMVKRIKDAAKPLEDHYKKMRKKMEDWYKINSGESLTEKTEKDYEAEVKKVAESLLT